MDVEEINQTVVLLIQNELIAFEVLDVAVVG